MQNNIKQIILVLTDDCNLECQYCFVHQSKNYMTLETAKKAVDFLFSNNINNKDQKLMITFFGGEPLLCYDSIIVPLVNYCKDNYNNYIYEFSITTNGILLNEINLKFFKENNFYLLLSMDGDYETQNYNRPYKSDKKNSFTFLYNKFELIKKYFPKIEIRATVTPKTISVLFKNFLFFEKEGFKYITFCPNMLEDWDENNLNIIEQELQKITLYYINYLSKNKTPSLKFLPYEKYLNNYNDNLFCQNNINCGLGNEIITIDYKEKIYSCQQMVTCDDNNIYIIGDLDNGIDINQQNQLKTLINSNCNYCHASSYIKNHEISQPLSINQIWENNILEQSKLILLLSYINNNF